VLVIILLLNLAILLYSAFYFLLDLGLPWYTWLSRDLRVVPLMIFILAGISGSLFILNLSVPFLVFYGPLLFRSGVPSGLQLWEFYLLVVIIDIIYVLATDFKLKSTKSIIWGLLAGCFLAIVYHRIQFGIDVNFKAPMEKAYRGVVDKAEEIF